MAKTAGSCRLLHSKAFMRNLRTLPRRQYRRRPPCRRIPLSFAARRASSRLHKPTVRLKKGPGQFPGAACLRHKSEGSSLGKTGRSLGRKKKRRIQVNILFRRMTPCPRALRLKSPLFPSKNCTANHRQRASVPFLLRSKCCRSWIESLEGNPHRASLPCWTTMPSTTAVMGKTTMKTTTGI